MRWLIVCLLSLLLGCTQDEKPATALVVSIKTDYAPGTELAEISFRAYALDSDVNHAFADKKVPATDMERPFVIEKGQDDEVIIAVQGLPPGGSTALVEHHVLARFEEGKSLQIPVFLGKVCQNQLCNDKPGQTCYWAEQDGIAPGKCGPLPPSQLSSVLETPMDYGKWTPPTSDGGLPDASQQCTATSNAGSCDPVTQCGCPANLHCQFNSGSSICALPGPAERGAACNTSSECGRGLSCFFNVCTPMCRESSECGGGGICFKPKDAPVGRCMLSCGASSPCKAGVTCNPVRLESGVSTFCFKPASPCIFVPDDQCDEPVYGTGLCATGTDAEDCEGLSTEHLCNAVTNNGCSSSERCLIELTTGASFKTHCATTGTKQAGETCDAIEDCARGTHCVGGLCKKACTSSSDCGGATCLPIQNGKGSALVPTVGVCSIPCTFATGAECKKGAVCARFAAPAGDQCFKQQSPCPYTGNGTCDETSRVCAVGTDTDCAR